MPLDRTYAMDLRAFMAGEINSPYAQFLADPAADLERLTFEEWLESRQDDGDEVPLAEHVSRQLN